MIDAKGRAGAIGPEEGQTKTTLATRIDANPGLGGIAQTLNTFITSSPKWLMTLTAIRPFGGLSKGREVSLLSVAQASGSISAFSVVLSEV